MRPYVDAGIVVDIGTGDGAFVYRSARTEPQRLFVGVDSNAENLAEASRKALRKPAKGGAPNALFVHAKAEALPEALDGLASQIKILFPWGSLLQAVVGADATVLQGIRRICRPGAAMHVVFGYSRESEPGVTNKLALPALDGDGFAPHLVRQYRDSGFEVQIQPLDRARIAEIPTTWARRLAYGKERAFSELVGAAV